MNQIAAVVCLTNQNKYSFNALLGALETTGLVDDIDIYFYKIREENIEILKEYINNHKKVILMFSFFTTQIWEVYSDLNRLKDKYGNNLLYLAGGPHPTGMPRETLDMGFDYVLIGEGEKTINDFFRELVIGGNIENVEGVAFIDEKGEFVEKKRIGQVDLNEYYPFSVKYRKFGPMEITRGCPFGCAFCQTTRIFGGNVRHRKVEFIEENLKIMNHYGLKDFRAVTPNALSYGSVNGKEVNLDKVYALLCTIRKNMMGKIYFGSFPSEVRPEHVSEDSIKVLKEFISNDNIILGAQTGSTKLLELCHRGHSIEDVYNAVEVLVRYKLVPNVDFIFGLPGESKSDVDCSLKVMKDLIKMGAKIHAHTFMPLPQTPFMYNKGGKVDERVKEYINKYLKNGVVYGNWGEQAILSKKIAHYMKTKDFDTT